MKKLIILILSLFLMQIACDKKSENATAKKPSAAVETSKSRSITGKIIFDSNRDFVKDQVRSLYLWENGVLRKFFKGGAEPRWSPNGQRVACVLWGTGNIALLDSQGNLIETIEPEHYALSVGWIDDAHLYYSAQDREKISRPKQYLLKYNVTQKTSELIYKSRDLGQIYQPQWIPHRDSFLVKLRDKIENQSELSSNAVLINELNGEIEILYQNGFFPVLLSDGETLLVDTYHLPDGSKIQGNVFAWGYLVKYNLRTKAHEVIRPTGMTRSTRLSRDGKYFYTAEPIGKENSVAILVYSVNNLTTPIFQIPTVPGGQDINPDWLQE